MNTKFFNGMFGKVGPGMCRVGINGEIAIKTSSGYKTYNANSGILTNCDDFAFDVGEDWFFIIPTNKVEKGDIILAAGRPCYVLNATDTKIEVFRYEDGTINTVVPEHHMFLGKQYFYGKIVSLFGNMMNGKGGMNNIMKYMMMTEMLKGNGNSNFSNMMPMMFMMNGRNNVFDNLFNFDNDEEKADKEDE